MRLTGFLALVAFGPGVFAEPVPVRGVTWQWCFRNPGVDFCLRTVDTMSALGYNAILPEFGACLESRHFAVRSGEIFRRDDFRTVLGQCRSKGLEVIPLLNTLGHGERSLPWPKTLSCADALTGVPVTVMDMGEEENYALLFSVLDEYQEDLSACGLQARYLHLGCDEASSVLAANAAKYSLQPHELLLRHLRRLRAYCLEKSVRMIVWHDMLMGSADPLYDGDMQYVHADSVASWTCRADLPRDIILMYWNYEPKSTHGVVSGLKDEGFDVWLMPWGFASVQTMAEWARQENLQGVVVSTWMDSGGNSPPGDNHFSAQSWMAESIARGADCLLDPEGGLDIPADDPVLRYIACAFPLKSVAVRPLSSSMPYGELANLGYLLCHAPSATLLGEWPKGTSNLDALTPPLNADWNGTAFVIDACNAVRGANQLMLYTREFGESTHCNGYGTEVAVNANGVVLSKSTWGVGDSRIPTGGYVLSGHGTAASSLKMNPGDKVNIRGANGVVLKGERVEGSGRVLVQMLPDDGRTVREVTFLWTAGRSLPMDGKVVGKVSLEYADGTDESVELAFGRDVSCWEAPNFFWGDRQGIRVWPASPESSGPNTGKALTGWSWQNPKPAQLVRTCRLELSDIGSAMGLLVAASAVTGATGVEDTLEGETETRSTYALDSKGPCRTVRSREELNALPCARCLAGELATYVRPDGTFGVFIDKASDEVRVMLPIDRGGLWVFDNPQEGTASFTVRHSIFGTFGDGTVDSPMRIVDEDELVDSRAGCGCVFTLAGQKSLLTSLAIPVGLGVEQLGRDLWCLVPADGGCLYRCSESGFSLDCRQSGPDRRIVFGDALPVAYSGNNWSGDASAIATLTLVSPSAQTNVLARCGSGSEPFGFGETGLWRVRLSMENGSSCESDIYVKGAFTVLIK